MSIEQTSSAAPFLESRFEDRPIIARWGPAVVHIADSTRHVDWAILVAKGDTPAQTFVWSDRPWEVRSRSVAKVQANRHGVFVGRHPMGVPLALIEDWTYEDDTSGVTWG